jgi:hypothetical protein
MVRPEASVRIAVDNPMGLDVLDRLGIQMRAGHIAESCGGIAIRKGGSDLNVAYGREAKKKYREKGKPRKDQKRLVGWMVRLHGFD